MAGQSGGLEGEAGSGQWGRCKTRIRNRKGLSMLLCHMELQ